MKKIERYKIRLEVREEPDPMRRSPARGALMHGLLMSEIARALPGAAGCAAEERETEKSLHQDVNEARPYSQYLYPCPGTPGSYIWTINLLSPEHCLPIEKFIDSKPEKLFIEHYKLPLFLVGLEQESTSYEEIFAAAVGSLPPKYASFYFLTPLVFKKSGFKNPWPFFEPRLILQSVLRRWNQFSDLASFEDKEILEAANNLIRLKSFSLDSQTVEMDGAAFSGSCGSCSFQVETTELRQLMQLCGIYSQYSGIGAKTAMGLGAVRYLARLPGKAERQGAPRNSA